MLEITRVPYNDGMTNSVDPDQTAPFGAVWSGSTLFPQVCLSEKGYLKFPFRIPLFCDIEFRTSQDSISNYFAIIVFLFSLIVFNIFLGKLKTVYWDSTCYLNKYVYIKGKRKSIKSTTRQLHFIIYRLLEKLQWLTPMARLLSFKVQRKFFRCPKKKYLPYLP